MRKSPPNEIGAAATRSVVLGTAGHIDHGKTALVLALTGTDTDRLPEEKARGITIDLGFAALSIAGPGGQAFQVSLIDVPGHHAFVRNMLAGAGGIDAVMLVVAADEGVKAQTVEHLQICRLLGIERGLVVLTKRDAVDEERLQAARDQVAQLVEGTFLEGAPVLAVSALQRQGIAELKTALGRLAAAVPGRGEHYVARLPVDRVFTVRGFGTVVTGTLQAGRVRAGEGSVLVPAQRRVRVRGLQVHGIARGEALAPNRVALNLAGVEVAEVTRGDTVVPESTVEAVSVVDATVELLAGADSLRHRQRVRVHAFASESLATALLYERAEGEPLMVRLRLDKPMVLIPGDRFVLRRPSPAMTIGGGTVVDTHPATHLRKAAAAAWLRQLRGARPAEVLRLRIARRAGAGQSIAQLVAETGWTREAVQRWLAPLLAEGRLVGAAGGELLLAVEAATAAEQRVLGELMRVPETRLGRAELRSKTGLSDEVFVLIMARLQAARRLELHGDVAALPKPAGSPGATQVLSGRALAVEQMYKAAGLASPLVSEAAERLGVGLTEMRGLITTLVRAGKLVRMGSDALLMHRESLTRLASELRARHQGRSFDVAWFKDYTGLTRKHAIPLLEYLDGARVTRNVGGQRTVL